MQLLLKANQELRTENQKLATKVEELEQYQRSNNLDIKGVPPTADPTVAVMQNGEVIGEAISESDIDICHGVPTRKPSERYVIVRFVQRSKRNAVLEKAKKKRGLTAQSLGFHDHALVYVNEHLTPQNKKLLGAAIAKKKEMHWKYAWSSGGKVYVRRDDVSEAVRIKGQDDLPKMTE